MNTTFFNIKRFSNLFRNDILLNHKKYLVTILGGILIFYLMMVYFMWHNHSNFTEDRYAGFLVLCALGVFAFIGSAFSDFNNRKGTCSYMLLPASIFEKYLEQILVRFILFIPLAALFFWADTYLARWTVLQFHSVQESGIIIDRFNYLHLIPNNEVRETVIILLGCFSLGTFLFSARLYFTRLALAKTIILAGVLLFLLGFFMVILSHIFYPAETSGFEVSIPNFNVFRDICNTTLYFYYLVSLSWVFFLPLGYFKLKEKQE